MEKKVIPFIRENDDVSKMLQCGLSCGYANGYVAVPPTNRFYGKHYNDVSEDISVHGGLTFSEFVKNGEYTIGSKRVFLQECQGKRTLLLDGIEYLTDDTEIPDDWFIFGFDTYHYGDNPLSWDRSRCISETMRLAEQLIEDRL